MAPTVVGVSTTAVWAPAIGADGPPYIPFTLDWPGAAAGRLVLLPTFARAAGTTIPLATGYTLKSTDNATGTNVTGEIQAKVAGSSESAPTITSGVLDTQPTAAIAIVVDGWSGSLSDVVVTEDAGANSNPIAPAGTAPVDGCLVLRGVMVADDNPVGSTGLTQVFAETSLHGSDGFMGWWSETANTGAVAAKALPLTAGSDGWKSYTIVIRPGSVAVEGSGTALAAATAAGTGRATRIGSGTAALVATAGGSGAARSRIVTRPNTGTVTRPNTGIVTRP